MLLPTLITVCWCSQTSFSLSVVRGTETFSATMSTVCCWPSPVASEVGHAGLFACVKTRTLKPVSWQRYQASWGEYVKNRDDGWINLGYRFMSLLILVVNGRGVQCMLVAVRVCVCFVAWIISTFVRFTSLKKTLKDFLLQGNYRSLWSLSWNTSIVVWYYCICTWWYVLIAGMGRLWPTTVLKDAVLCLVAWSVWLFCTCVATPGWLWCWEGCVFLVHAGWWCVSNCPTEGLDHLQSEGLIPEMSVSK